MNKLATALVISIFASVLVGCSSGNSSTEETQNVAGRYAGTFENTDGNQDGTVLFTLTQTDDGNVIGGTAIFDTTTTNTCLVSGPIMGGEVVGFNVTFLVGNTRFQLAVSNAGNTLSGTYVQDAPPPAGSRCSIQSGSGTITVDRG